MAAVTSHENQEYCNSEYNKNKSNNKWELMITAFTVVPYRTIQNRWDSLLKGNKHKPIAWTYIIYVLDQHWEKTKETHDKNIVNNHTLDSSNKLTAFNFSRNSLQSSWKHIKMTESLKTKSGSMSEPILMNLRVLLKLFDKINIYNKLKLQ